MLLDGSVAAEGKLEKMLYFDVNNGIARRAWARNKEANQALDSAMASNPTLQVTRAQLVDDHIIDELFNDNE
ncbi:urocanate hydratase [compost metagenome]